MAITIADSYYLKALDLYPYELDQVTEALNYAVGYDDEHAGAHNLLGMLNIYQLGNYSEAEKHFEKALASDINHVQSYYNYADLLIEIGEFERAKKLIDHAYKIKGARIPRLKRYEGLIAEISGDLAKAKEYMNSAYKNSCRKYERDFFRNELARIKAKIKDAKKEEKKEKDKKKKKKK